MALVKEIQLPACKGHGDYWQTEKPKQCYVKLMYRLENASDTIWSYGFLKNLALCWLVASMLSLALEFPGCQRLHDHGNHLLLLFCTVWHGEIGFIEEFFGWLGFGFFPTQLFVYYERAVPVVLWILCVCFQCVVAG